MTRPGPESARLGARAPEGSPGRGRAPPSRSTRRARPSQSESVRLARGPAGRGAAGCRGPAAIPPDSSFRRTYRRIQVAAGFTVPRPYESGGPPGVLRLGRRRAAAGPSRRRATRNGRARDYPAQAPSKRTRALPEEENRRGLDFSEPRPGRRAAADPLCGAARVRHGDSDVCVRAPRKSAPDKRETVGRAHHLLSRLSPLRMAPCRLGCVCACTKESPPGSFTTIT